MRVPERMPVDRRKFGAYTCGMQLRGDGVIKVGIKP